MKFFSSKLAPLEESCAKWKLYTKLKPSKQSNPIWSNLDNNCN